MGDKSTIQQSKNELLDANTVKNTKAVLNTLPDHSRGAKLSDFTKPNDEFPDGLSPAEQKLLHACTRGEECIIGNGTRPTSATHENKIRASFLRYLILGGCGHVPIHQRGIRLIGAFINCRNGFLDLQSTYIKQDIAIVNSKINGSIYLIGTTCQTFNIQGSSIHKLMGDRLFVKGGLYLRSDFLAKDIIRLVGATIQGPFDCSNGRLEGLQISLAMDGAIINGDLSLSYKFVALGDIRLINTTIKRQLSCRDGLFHANINAQNAFIYRNVWLDNNFQIIGTVDFRNVQIEGNIECARATFHNRERAILANKATIKGNITLGDCNSAGGFAFQGAQIGGDFSASKATISAKKSIEFRNATIAGTLHWRDIDHAPGMLDLGGATVKTLNMDEKSWQKPESIKLNNFSYQGFSDLEKGANSHYWKKFLEQQPKADLTNKFRPKPFEHLANILQGIGLDEEAKNIRIERQKRQTQFMADHDPDRFYEDNQGNQHIKIMHYLTWFWRKFVMGIFIDYGFRPGKAALFLFGLIAFGTLVYWHAANKGIMTPTHPLIYKEATNGGFIPEKCADNWVYFPKDIEQICADAMPSEYSEFQSFIYAADVALPIVNFRMEGDWSPRVVDVKGQRDLLGWWVRTFEWFSIFAGWMLSLLIVSALGGIIRR